MTAAERCFAESAALAGDDDAYERAMHRPSSRRAPRALRSGAPREGVDVVEPSVHAWKLARRMFRIRIAGLRLAWLGLLIAPAACSSSESPPAAIADGGSGATDSGPTDNGTNAAAFSRCAAIEAASERLACYDALNARDAAADLPQPTDTGCSDGALSDAGSDAAPNPEAWHDTGCCCTSGVGSDCKCTCMPVASCGTVFKLTPVFSFPDICNSGPTPVQRPANFEFCGDPTSPGRGLWYLKTALSCEPTVQ